jgi:hypothetical protein
LIAFSIVVDWNSDTNLLRIGMRCGNGVYQ